ncbi:MAG: flagellar motor switch protein FliM [Eubacteriales bacterium]|nr:flagellar motor switch protein FliM [Eubacteriales bacterium]
MANDGFGGIINAYKDRKNMDLLKTAPVESYEKVRLYNFRIPNRFTKDQLRALRGIYENFANSLSSHLSGILRKFCQVELISVEEHTFSEFNNTILDPVLLAMIELEPFQGISLMDISPVLAYAIIDRLMGGEGRVVRHARRYTEIEVALMEKLASQFLEIMKDSWSVFYEVNPKLERIETRSQFAQIVPANEIIAIVTFSVRMGEVDGMINYCIPHVLVEPLFKDAKYKSEFFRKSETVQESKSDIIIKKIENSYVDVVATFADTTVSTRDITNLQEGDVLMLDHKVNQAINIKVNNVVKFAGTIGKKDSKYAVKIIDKIEDAGADIF